MKKFLKSNDFFFQTRPRTHAKVRGDEDLEQEGRQVAQRPPAPVQRREFQLEQRPRGRGRRRGGRRPPRRLDGAPPAVIVALTLHDYYYYYYYTKNPSTSSIVFSYTIIVLNNNNSHHQHPKS